MDIRKLILLFFVFFCGTTVSSAETQVLVTVELGRVKDDFKELVFDRKTEDVLKLLGKDARQIISYIHLELKMSVNVEATYTYAEKETKMVFSVHPDDAYLKSVKFINAQVLESDTPIPQLDLSDLQKAAQEQSDRVSVLEKAFEAKEQKK